MAKVCKYYKQVQQVSYDGGNTWQSTGEYRMGELYERNSRDCGGGSAIYRTVALTGCINMDMFQWQQEQVSYDGGETWENTDNVSGYTCIETDVNECGWQMPDMTNVKKYEVYSKYGNYGHNCWPGVYSVVVPTDFYYVSTDCNGNTSTTGSPSDTSGYPDHPVDGLHTLIYGECGSNITIEQQSQNDLSYNTGHDACGMSYGNMGNPYPHIILSSKVTEIGIGGCKESHFNKFEWSTEPDSIILRDSAFKNTKIDNFKAPKNIVMIGDRAFESAQIGTVMAFNKRVMLDTNIFAGSSVKTLTFNAGADYIGAAGWSPWQYTSVEKITLNGPKAAYTYNFEDFSGILIDNRTEGGLKYKGEYSDGAVNSVVCDDNDVLTTSDTKPTGYNPNHLTKITIGNCVKTIGTNAFSGCTELSSMTIPNSVTTINGYAFWHCYGLTGTLVIPNGVTTIGGSNAFGGLTGITGISFSSNLQTIGNSAFIGCNRVLSLTIPNSVTSIGDGAFRGCSVLQSITLQCTTPPSLGTGAFANTNSCDIYVPTNSRNLYLNHVDWVDYISRIKTY